MSISFLKQPLAYLNRLLKSGKRYKEVDMSEGS